MKDILKQLDVLRVEMLKDKDIGVLSKSKYCIDIANISFCLSVKIEELKQDQSLPIDEGSLCFEQDFCDLVKCSEQCKKCSEYEKKQTS